VSTAERNPAADYGAMNIDGEAKNLSIHLPSSRHLPKQRLGYRQTTDTSTLTVAGKFKVGVFFNLWWRWRRGAEAVGDIN